MKPRCTNCAQQPELKQTGKSPDKAQLYCLVCKTEYYIHKDGTISKDRSTDWPTTKPKEEKWELEDGYWRKK